MRCVATQLDSSRHSILWAGNAVLLLWFFFQFLSRYRFTAEGYCIVIFRIFKDQFKTIYLGSNADGGFSDCKRSAIVQNVKDKTNTFNRFQVLFTKLFRMKLEVELQTGINSLPSI